MLQIFKNKISTKLALNGFFIMFLIGLSYHFLILTRIIDYKYAWGGRLQSLTQMYQFETVSVLLQFLFLGIILIKIKTKKFQKFMKFLLFVMVFLFLLNTVGNIFAKESLETILFTPMTFLSAIFVFRLAVD